MKKALCLLIIAQFFIAAPARALAQDAVKSVQQSAAPAALLRNSDVLEMLAAGLSPEVVVAKIRSSQSDFDTSLAAMKVLKGAGVPDAVLLAMVEAPRALVAAEPRRVVMKVPVGTRVEVESGYRVSSQEAREGDMITFRVVNPVIVGGATVVERGAVATARVTRAERGGHYGRAGRLVWEMYEVAAVDGTRLQLQFAGRQVGDSKGAKVAAQMVAMGVLLGPFAPATLLFGFKRGENAYLPEGKRYDVFVRTDASVNALEGKE